MKLANVKAAAWAPGCSERANAQVAPSTSVKAPPSCLHDSQVSPFITAAGAPPTGAQRDGENERDCNFGPIV